LKPSKDPMRKPTDVETERAQLRAFADVILADDFHPGELRHTLRAFETWLIRLSELDIDSEICRSNIETAHGIALAPTWAALCVEDSARTRAFVRGTFQAVQKHRSLADQATRQTSLADQATRQTSLADQATRQTSLADQATRQTSAHGDRPVHVLYAGCGPFATLVLPLLAYFSEQQLRLSLIDINPISVACVQRLFARLNLQGYLEDVLLADAMSMKLAKPQEIDIVLSETMQRALKNECQVQIMSNLMTQLPEHVLMLPERITLTLAQIDLSKPLEAGNGKRPFETLGTLFELTKATIASALWEQRENHRYLITEEITVSVPHEHINLYVLTNIAICGDAKLELNQSGLSTPEKILLPISLRRTDANFGLDLDFPVQCRVRYVIDPKARIELSVAPIRAPHSL
jgi:hypothetical protein